ncbi:MAG: HupE/UreJ family protein [Pseudomonadota bacterium]
MNRLFSAIGICCLWGLSALSQAHQLSTAYLTGEFSETGIFVGQWQVRLYDLEQAIGVDSDSDGKLRWQEVQNRAEAITEYLQNNVQVVRATQACSLAVESEWQIDTHFNEGYLVVPVRAQCPLAGEVIIHYSAFFNEDSQHKLLFTLRSQTGTQSHSPRILSDAVRTLSLSETAGSKFATFKEFVVQGAVHIWIGFDHILFLISLLLTAVLIRKDKQWVANNNIRNIIVNTLWIVTAFTLAHSITLTATALHWMQLPSRWVEVSIAISVALAALNNIFPLVLRLGWLTFGFGLLHGMGFAGALGELGLPADQQFLTVLAFNLGVELGQMAIVLVVLPLLISIRNYSAYIPYGLKGLSLVIVLIAIQWIVQRI